MEMIGIIPSYNAMKCQLQSMSGSLLGTCHKMSATVNVRYIEMLGTYPIACRYT